MTEDIKESIEVKTPFFSTKIAGKNFTIRDIILLFVFGGMIASGTVGYEHAVSADKSNSALLREIKEANKEQNTTQKNIAFYQCKAACILEYDQKDRAKGSVVCDAICAPVKQ